MSLQYKSKSIENRSFQIIKNFQETNDTFGVSSNGEVIYITKYGMYDLDANIQLTVVPDLSFCDVLKHGITLDSQFEYEISKAKPVETVIQQKIIKQNLEKSDIKESDLDKSDLYTNKNTKKSNRFFFYKKNIKNIKQISKTARSRKKKISKSNKIEVDNESFSNNGYNYLFLYRKDNYICECKYCMFKYLM
jgi:hypothetical protein